MTTEYINGTNLINAFLKQIDKEMTLTENLIAREILTAYENSLALSNVKHVLVEEEKKESKK